MINSKFFNDLRAMSNWRSQLTPKQRIHIRRHELATALIGLLRR